MNDWPSAVCAHLAQDGAVARVVVAEVLGSAPREAGAWMLVTRDAIEGTIGGGNLEWQAIGAARELLTLPTGGVARKLIAGPSAGAARELLSDPCAVGACEPLASPHAGVAPERLARTSAAAYGPPDASHAGAAVRTWRVTLARDAGQCCGGVVQLWIERFTLVDLPILQRAAHAADSPTPTTLSTEVTPGGVTRFLSGAADPSARVRFERADNGDVTLVERLDSARAPIWLYGAGHVGQALVRTLADLPFDVTWIDSRPGLFPTTTPARVHAIETPNPVEVATRAPSTARHIVMTHDHAIDYALCHAILSRNAFGWLGLIGSISKAARFRSRLRRDGIPRERIDRLVSPIGLTDIRSKLPAAIAIGVAAQLLREDQPRIVVQAAEDCGTDCASCRSHPLTLP